MTPAAPREPSLGELHEDLGELKAKLDRFTTDFLPREVYEARHKGLRDNLALELKNLQQEIQALRHSNGEQFGNMKELAESADRKAMWAIAMIAITVIGAIVTAVITGGQAIP